MWKAAASDQLAGSCKSARKRWRIGSLPIQANCRLPKSLQSHGRLSWMRCIPLWARKKRNLHPNHCGSRHALLAELGCGAHQKHRSYASLSRASATSQTILLGCLSALRQSLLWRTLRNAHRQERDLCGGSSKCRFAPLLETLGSQIQVLLPQTRGSCQEHSLVCLLLQPKTTYETSVSQILLSSHRFPLSSLLDTPKFHRQPPIYTMLQFWRSHGATDDASNTKSVQKRDFFFHFLNFPDNCYDIWGEHS